MIGALPFNVVDYAVLALLAYGALTGLVHGLSAELARTLAVAGLAVAVWRLHPSVTGLLESVTRLEPKDTPLVAIGLLVAAALVAFLLGRALLRGIFRFCFKGLVERLGGLIAGTLRNALLAAALLLALGYAPVQALHRAVTEDSWFGARAHAILPDAYAEASARYGLPPLPDAPGTIRESEGEDDANGNAWNDGGPRHD